MSGETRFASDAARAGQETQVGSRRRQRTQLAPHEGQVEGAALTRHPVVRVEDEDGAHRSLKATPGGRDTEPRAGMRAAHPQFHQDRLFSDVQRRGGKPQVGERSETLAGEGANGFPPLMPFIVG